MSGVGGSGAGVVQYWGVRCWSQVKNVTPTPDPPLQDILSGIGNMKPVCYTGLSFVRYRGIGVYWTSRGMTVLCRITASSCLVFDNQYVFSSKETTIVIQILS